MEIDGLESAVCEAVAMRRVGRREGCGQPRRRLICFCFFAAGVGGGCHFRHAAEAE